MAEEKRASVSSSNIVMATITKSFSALISLIIISNSIRIRKKIKIRNYYNNTKLINHIHSQRESRFLNPFSLFSIVRFENTECTTSSGTLGGKLEQLYKIRQHFVCRANRHNNTRQAGQSCRFQHKGKQGRCRFLDYSLHVL